MRSEIKERINELFSSYDLLSGSGVKRNTERIKSVFPDITDAELKEIFNYLDGFEKYCDTFGEKLSREISAPMLPEEGEDGKLVAECVAKIREKYPEIDEAHVKELLGNYCWLSNR